MFAKVHPAKDVQSGNTGSCHDLVHGVSPTFCTKVTLR